MLLAVDVGNSNIVWSAWNGTKWNEPLRFNTHGAKGAEELRMQLSQWMKDQNIQASAISSAIISSVVPTVTKPLQQVIDDYLGINATILTAQTDTGIMLGAERPERVGADLIADAVGAYALIDDRCIVVDLGTATTVMAVENPGTLSGVAICTGLKVSIEALVGKAAQLQDIPLEIPDSPLGKNTIEAMQSGLVLGHLCMVEGLIERIKLEIGPSKVVATGGLIDLLAPHTKHFDYVEPMLTLNGLRMVAERQGENGKSER